MQPDPVPTDSNETRPQTGELRLAISNRLVSLYREYYGKGPTKCRTYLVGDVVVTVMEQVFTTIERTLVQAGEEGSVREVRFGFQEAMKERFTSAVEDLTERKVRTFLSAFNVEAETIVEVFMLEPQPNHAEVG